MHQHTPPPPDSRELLPPLLACLPTAAISSRPPPALLPLLSPLLRQRLAYLAENTGNKSWIGLLSWIPEQSAKLPAVVERMDLEPHPVSGELEIEDLRPARYQRLDEETLHARLEVDQFDLLPIYVWCEKDEHGGTEPGWKLAELRALEDLEDGTQWFDSPVQASDAFVGGQQAQNGHLNGNGATAQTVDDDNDNDNDDYWAAYDRTPGQTPAPSNKPNPHPTNGRQMADAQYFARYGNEVQPALDAHDPDEEESTHALGESTLRGDSIVNGSRNGYSSYGGISAAATTLHAPHPTTTTKADESGHLSMPRPISPASSHSSVERLEEQAAAMSGSRGNDAADRAQLGIKMHISTDIKSLFRLARSSGMERKEFEDIVRRELDVLGFMEQDD